MPSQCPRCHEMVEDDAICCAGMEFEWKCEKCHKRDRGFAIPFGRCIFCGGKLSKVEEEGSTSDVKVAALQEAFQIEVSSHIFYNRLANVVEDPNAKSFFILMAEKEKEHADELTSRYHLRIDKTLFEDSGKDLPEPFFTALNFFTSTGDMSRLYECAIDFETKTLNFFLEKANSFKEEGAERDLYLELAAEEREHVALLESERDR